MLFTMVKETMNLHVLLNLVSRNIVFASFDLQIFRNGVDTISLVINFLNKSWTPMHIIVSLFEMNETI
jgi:hypothetical protein